MSNAIEWTEVAKLNDQDAFLHFVRLGQDAKRARNNVSKLRHRFNPDGSRKRHSDGKPAAQLPGYQPFPVPIHPQTPNTDSVEPESETQQHMTQPVLTVPAPSNDAASALAAMIAPALAGMVSYEIAKAVAEIHAKMALVKQMVVVRDRIETKLDGTHHSVTPKLLQLVNQGLNVMLVGPAGSGKTVLAHSIAAALRKACVKVCRWCE